MSDRVKASIEFKMPEHWLADNHPVGKAIQGLYSELARAYQGLYSDGTEGTAWAEWAESYEDVED